MMPMGEGQQQHNNDNDGDWDDGRSTAIMTTMDRDNRTMGIGMI